MPTIFEQALDELIALHAGKITSEELISVLELALMRAKEEADA